MRHHLTRTAACVACAVMIVACSSDPESAASTTVGEVESVSADALEELLITSLPEGFEQVDDADADTGPSDLAKAVRDDGGADAEEVLTEAGFERGYQRSWLSEDEGSLIIVFLYEFSDPEGASSYGARTVASFDANPDLDAAPFEVDGIPEASGRSLSNFDEDGGLASSIMFTKSGYLVQLVVIGPTDDGNQELATELARDQFDRL